MCVSGRVPGFIVAGLMGCQRPPPKGFSSFQYPCGYCWVGGIVRTLQPAGICVGGSWGGFVGGWKFGDGFGGPLAAAAGGAGAAAAVAGGAGVGAAGGVAVGVAGGFAVRGGLPGGGLPVDPPLLNSTSAL